jgi:hypothetical protein
MEDYGGEDPVAMTGFPRMLVTGGSAAQTLLLYWRSRSYF